MDGFLHQNLVLSTIYSRLSTSPADEKLTVFSVPGFDDAFHALEKFVQWLDPIA